MRHGKQVLYTSELSGGVRPEVYAISISRRQPVHNHLACSRRRETIFISRSPGP